MSAQRKRAVERQPAAPQESASPTTDSPNASSRQESSSAVTASSAIDECIAAICLVEVTLHSLEWQEIASPEQEVLRRALKAIWIVHDWFDGLEPDDLHGEGSDPEDDEP